MKVQQRNFPLLKLYYKQAKGFLFKYRPWLVHKTFYYSCKPQLHCCGRTKTAVESSEWLDCGIQGDIKSHESCLKNPELQMKQHIALFSLKHLPNVSTYDPEQEQLNNDIFMIFYFTFRALLKNSFCLCFCSLREKLFQVFVSVYLNHLNVLCFHLHKKNLFLSSCSFVEHENICIKVIKMETIFVLFLSSHSKSFSDIININFWGP